MHCTIVNMCSLVSKKMDGADFMLSTGDLMGLRCKTTGSGGFGRV